MRRRQRRLLSVTLIAVALIAAGIGVYFYVDNAPVRADKQFQDGMKMMHPGKYGDAVVLFTRALASSPPRAEVYLERANAYQGQGEADLALADFQTALSMDPTMFAAHNGIALIYIQRHDVPHAFEELNKSAALRPNIEAYYQRGQLWEAQGEHQKAIDDYDRAIDLSRDSPFIYLARATAKANLGDLEGAEADRIASSQLQR
jgi:tetratricopeptide (TPR) repeat protein